MRFLRKFKRKLIVLTLCVAILFAISSLILVPPSSPELGYTTLIRVRLKTEKNESKLTHIKTTEALKWPKRTTVKHICGKDLEGLKYSNKLPTRYLWAKYTENYSSVTNSNLICSNYSVRLMVSGCRLPVAIASYPGSGNTWLRYLIEASSGIFTGSRYKDIQLQMHGFWGEIRKWNDGTTIVQKTHDASPFHVKQNFGGRAILLLRNPYDAILSHHNFLYAGHKGYAPSDNFQRPDWSKFVTIQASMWLDMATNWTVHSNSKNTLIIHYENLVEDELREIRKVLRYLRVPISEQRLACLKRNLNGYFRRKRSSVNGFPFSSSIRNGMDRLIDFTNSILTRRQYEPLPILKYRYYKQTDSEISQWISQNVAIFKKNSRAFNSAPLDSDVLTGSKIILDKVVKWYMPVNLPSDKMSILSSNTSAKILNSVVNIWPILKAPFMKDPIIEIISTDNFRGNNILDLLNPIP